ncbi:MAG TPA: tetratricopeptide repeat-containing protein, partial [Pyrinomonadaceae bacterium]|nr:tetratricopeptide repeat-containing protein [Pyrinomonadaceae bacterium]
MRRPVILTMLACALLVVIPSQALAQSDEALAEANRLKDKCLEFYRAGKYDEAIEHCQRVLLINETALGPEHPDVATSLNNLALLHKTKSEYAKAEPLYLRALAIREKTFASEHPAVANSLSNLAELYRAKGEYAKAEPLYLRALAINEKMLGPEHPFVATVLNNLALLYRAKGEYAKAEPLYVRSLAIREKTLGGEHPLVAISLNNLALLHNMKGDYVKAEPLYQRALAIRETAFGNEHPDVAQSLNNLALLRHMKGEYAKAEPLFLRALLINEKALGPEHPEIANSLNNLALLYEAKGEYPRAVEVQMRGQEIRESNINAILATGSENQKQLYLNTLAGETHATVSLHAHSAPTNVQAARLALTTILRRKGRALDAMTDQIAGLRRRAAPGDVKLLDALAAAQSQLSTLQLSNNTSLSPTARRTRVAELETEIEKLEGDISRRNAEFRARTQPVTLDVVRAAIPTDAALVEIFAYQPFNAKA